MGRSCNNHFAPDAHVADNQISVTRTGERTLWLWLARPSDLATEEATDACARLLSEEERARWQSFRLERDRRQYLATHALARTALSHFVPREPETLQFSTNDWGKPNLDPDCGIRFNLSNCSGLVACLIARGTEVGIDAEAWERGAEIAGLRAEVFSEAEQHQLERLPEHEKLDRALTLWTLKEAWVKAMGMGLSLPLNRVSFLQDEAGEIRMMLDKNGPEDSGQCWRFCLLDYAGHRLALAVDSATTPSLEVLDLRLPLAFPLRVPDAGEVWHPRAV